MGLFSSIGKFISKVAKPIGEVVGIGTGLLGGYSAYQSGKAAESYAETAEESSEWQARLANEQWQRYLDTFAPLEDTIVKEASSPVEEQPGFARMMGTIDRGYSDVAANTRRTLAGRYPSGSGLEVLNLGDIEMERTRTKAGAVADLSESRFNRMLNAANLGRSLPSTASSSMGRAASGQASLANMYGNAAGQTWGALGNVGGNLMQMYMLNKYLKTPVASAGDNSGYLWRTS